MDHRGARGAEPNTGDGAGIMIQIPDAFLREVAGFDAAAGRRVRRRAWRSCPPTTRRAERAMRVAGEVRRSSRAPQVLGWRDVPTDADGPRPDRAGRDAAHPAGVPRRGAAGSPGSVLSGLDLDRVVYCVRKQAERETRERGVELYFPSLSSRTIVYKGMLTTDQLASFFPDLSDERFASAIALVHTRFSTNTFPSWPLAHPFRLHRAQRRDQHRSAATATGCAAREALLRQRPDPGRPAAGCSRSARRTRSDSATFDEVLELLHLGGRSLPHAVLMMIPEAWENDPRWTRRGGRSTRFHACLMEPWDGPACVTFTDGTVVGAVLDRNGLRPGRWWQTADGLVVLASEAGVLDLDPATVVAKGRLAARQDVPRRHRRRPHRRTDDEIKAELARPSTRTTTGCTPGCMRPRRPARPRARRLHARVGAAPPADLRLHRGGAADPARRRWRATGAEPLGSMGTDTPIAVLSQPAAAAVRLLHPAVRAGDQPAAGRDPRGAGHPSRPRIGPEQNLLEPGPASCRQIVLPYPVIDNDELAKMLSHQRRRRPARLQGRPGLAGSTRRRRRRRGVWPRLVESARAVSEAIEDGVRDPGALRPRLRPPTWRRSRRCCSPPRCTSTWSASRPAPRSRLVVETGDCREVHHVALLIGLRRRRGQPVPGLRDASRT